MGKPVPRLAWAGAAGGIVPDLPMYVIILGLRARGFSLDTIFREIYWEDWWQIANAIGHNFILWGIITIASAIFIASRGSFSSEFSAGGKTALTFAFSASALLHSAIDFLCHRDDGHMHFWPFSKWRFESPVSYWDPAHFGLEFSLFEASLGLLIALALFRRYKNTGLRIAITLAILAYVAVPTFYFWSLGT